MHAHDTGDWREPMVSPQEHGDGAAHDPCQEPIQRQIEQEGRVRVV